MCIHLLAPGSPRPPVNIELTGLSYDPASTDFLLSGAAVLVRVLSRSSPRSIAFGESTCTLLFETTDEVADFASALEAARAEVRRLNRTAMD